MNTEDDFAGLEDFLPDVLPDGTVPVCGIVIVEYVTPKGETEHVYQELGDASQVQMLGLLEIGKRLVFEEMEDSS